MFQLIEFANISHDNAINTKTQFLRQRITLLTFVVLLSLFAVVVSVFVFSFSLKLDCEKLVQEKTEMQRHYVMVRATLRGK